MGLIGLASCAVSGGIGGGPIGTGLLFIIMSRTLRSAPLIAIRDDHLEIKGAPFAGKVFIALDEIQAVDEVKKNVLGLEVAGPTGSTWKKIGISQVDRGAVDDFIAWLQKRIDARPRAASA